MVFYKKTQGLSKGGLCYGRWRRWAMTCNSIGHQDLMPSSAWKQPWYNKFWPRYDQKPSWGESHMGAEKGIFIVVWYGLAFLIWGWWVRRFLTVDVALAVEPLPLWLHTFLHFSILTVGGSGAGLSIGSYNSRGLFLSQISHCSKLNI